MADQSAFLEFLEFLGRPGQAVKNTLAGRGEAAMRQIGQMGLDNIDAVLPGDWLPNDLAREEDDISGRELIGADDDFGGNVAGFGVDMLTDPLTYIPGAALAKGAKLAGGAVKSGATKVAGKEAVETAGKAINKAGRHVRSTFGAQRLSDPIRKVVDSARGGKLAGSAGLLASKKALEGLDERQLNVIGDAIDNFKWENGKLVGELVGTSIDPVMGKRAGSLMERIAAHPELAPGEAERLVKAAEELTGIGRTMKGRKGIFSPEDQANLSDEYLMRSYEGLPENELLELTAGSAKPLKERSLEGFREVQDFLAKPGNEKVTYTRNALKRALSRADSQGKLATRADIGQGLMGLLREGAIQAPDNLVDDAARSVGAVKGPVPDSGAAADVARMLGGDVTDVANQDAILREISGTSLPPKDGIPSAVAMDPPVAPSVDPYGIGKQSGTSLAPKAGKSSPIVALLLQGKLKEARAAVEKMALGGELDESTLKAYKGMLDEAAGAGETAIPEVADDVFDSMGAYGVGGQSGRARPPKTKILPPADELGAYGLGGQSGRSIAPATRVVDESNRSLLGYGVGEQTGKSVVGARTTKTIGELTDAQRAAGKSKLLEKDFSYSNPEHRSLINGAIAEIGKTDPESAKFLYGAMNGMPARGWLTSLLAKSNSIFKPAATAGYIIPKLGFSVRNRLSGIWSTASVPEARGVAAKGALRAPGDIISAVAEGMGLKTGDRLGSAVNAWDDALRNSGGSAEKALDEYAKVHPDAAALIKAGGLDGFVRSEDILKELTSNGTFAKLHRMAKWPSKIAKGVEDRMRLGLGMDLIAAGKSPDEAAKIVRDVMFDYDITSASNRAYRDFVPFGQYVGKAVPQQAKFLAEKPWVAAGLGHALDQDSESPTMPWMDGKLQIPLGDNQYITGLGLPFEALNQIPNPSASLNQFGRDIEKNVVGSSQPVAKTAYGAVTGEDPFFESPFGSYDRMPIIGKAGEAGRLYNIGMGTGLGSAAQAPLNTVDKVFDDRKSPLLKAADLLTGINVTTVDPDLAIQSRINQALKNNPDVRQIRTPINVSGGDETDAMLDELRAVKARLKAKREQEAAKASSVL